MLKEMINLRTLGHVTCNQRSYRYLEFSRFLSLSLYDSCIASLTMLLLMINIQFQIRKIIGITLKDVEQVFAAKNSLW